MLTELVFFLLKRSDEVAVRAETLRLLLERHGVFSQTEFDALFLERIAQKKRATLAFVEELAQGALSEEQRQTLAAYKGTVQ